MSTTSAWRRRPFARYALLLFALVLVGGLYAALSRAPRADAAQGPSKEQVAQGKALFQTSCASCHGLAAQGTRTGPSLYGVGAAAVDFQVGTGRMPLSAPAAQAKERPPQFSQEQIDALAAYVQSLSPGPRKPEGVDSRYPDADLTLGGELFRANCAQCHNFAGVGGALTHGKGAPDLTDASPTHIYEAMQTGPENMPVFARSLTDDEKLSIVRFVKHTAAEPNPGGAGLGRIGPTSEGLVGWIIGIGAIIAASAWIVSKKEKGPDGGA